jgi:hypothetical protein
MWRLGISAVDLKLFGRKAPVGQRHRSASCSSAASIDQSQSRDRFHTVQLLSSEGSEVRLPWHWCSIISLPYLSRIGEAHAGTSDCTTKFAYDTDVTRF